jgi:hypothetical protein
VASRAMRGYAGLCGAMQGYAGLCGAMLGYTGLYGAIRGYAGLCLCGAYSVNCKSFLSLCKECVSFC